MMSFLTLRGQTAPNTAYKGIVECALPGQHGFIFDLFKSLVPSGAKVADLASGHGAWARRLADAEYDVLACDIAPERCAVPCRAIDLNTNFSDKMGQVDAVSCIEMLEHIENPRHIFREAAKMLPKGGKLILSTPNASGLHSRLKFLVTGRFAQFDDLQYDDIGHIRPISYWELEKMLNEAGFTIKDTRFYGLSSVKTLGDLVKKAAYLLAPIMRGTAGGQVLVVAAEKD